MQHGRFLIAEAPFRKQYGALNIWEEPNGKIVGILKNGGQGTMYKLLEPIDGETWVKIGEKQFVNMEFLKNANPRDCFNVSLSGFTLKIISKIDFAKFMICAIISLIEKLIRSFYL